MKDYVLNNGVKIPSIGFGTFLAKDGEETYRAVRAALDAGYRHIDTAAIYGNEVSVGRALADSGVAREDIFVTTKLWNDNHTAEQAHAALDESLTKLGLDYVDLYLVHWPNPSSVRSERGADGWKERNAAVWSAMEADLDAGKTRALGVSNFMKHHLDELLKTARVTPAVNQIRLAPGVYQTEAIEASRAHGILLEAWGPLGQGELFANETVRAMADKYGKTVAQLAVAWSLQNGFLPLPKSVTPERIASNLDALDVTLSAEDMETLKNLPVQQGADDPDVVSW
ncbi:aldo/keto reductase [Alloscardovia macacae]|uniref:2,5-diketo-D-gluconic acid reductase n=1 Tax=Alloscardovia macacae TaxID=1160091 RepID=A0A261F7F5_9BIFI|nr:aldo/keto reductase [Alloscardovia macacae]OZG55071.1 2,5-diketo-D-gluconic acid reductase [Alloscardovia macacae]